MQSGLVCYQSLDPVPAAQLEPESGGSGKGITGFPSLLSPFSPYPPAVASGHCALQPRERRLGCGLCPARGWFIVGRPCSGLAVLSWEKSPPCSASRLSLSLIPSSSHRIPLERAPLSRSLSSPCLGPVRFPKACAFAMQGPGRWCEMLTYL